MESGGTLLPLLYNATRRSRYIQDIIRGIRESRKQELADVVLQLLYVHYFASDNAATNTIS